MRKPKHSDAQPGPEQREMFLSFIHHVSPEVDPTSVMLFGQVMHARNLLVQIAEKDLVAAGLTWGEFRVLMTLQRQDYCSTGKGLAPSELSELLSISPNTVSALINNLESAGLITRELHPTDRRKFVIRLTPSGHQLLKSQMDNHLRCIGSCFSAFNPRERQTLHELLVRLNASLKRQAEKHAGAAGQRDDKTT